jgi:YrbI family 3-deoxy-D-manno-octulosonate 8-phosphate phosphatase
MCDLIKMVCFDFDGTFSNGQFHLTTDGLLSKSYNGKDSYGIKLLHDNSVLVGIITAHDSVYYDHLIKLNYFNKLDFFYKGHQDKLEILDGWRNEYGLQWNEIAYMGDDLGDLSCLKMVGLAACPSDSVKKVKTVCDYISDQKAGSGAVREFIDYLIDSQRLGKVNFDD